MSGSIPRSFIDDLLAQTDIVEVIDSRVKLKKSGKEYQACCPFHHEKTPSFTVSPQKQFYYCFGCHAKGNAIGFLMEYEQLSFVESIEELAQRLGLEVPYEQNGFGKKDPMSQKQKRSLYDLMQNIALYYAQQLPQNPQAKNYFSERGLSEEIIERFQLGYASDGFNHMQQVFGTCPDNRKNLLDLGMQSKNDNGNIYDRFRHRVMFPIRDRRGRVIAFGGRVLDDSKPKYLNSPESATYHKGNELYGLYEALQSHQSLEKILVVEGYMDVVALAQFGVHYAVASLGTATTPEQLRLAFRHTDQIICCYDADRAGKEAAWRALENVLPLLEDGRQIKFVFLPDGEDPDSFIRTHGKAAFEDYLNQAQGFNEFFFAHLKPQVDFTSREGKLKLLPLAMPMINQIPGLALKHQLIDKVQQLIGIQDKNLINQFVSANKTLAVDNASANRLTPIRLLIGLLIQNPQLAHLTTQSGNKIQLLPLKTKDTGWGIFNELFQYCQSRVGLNTGLVLEHWRDHPYVKPLENLASWNLHIDDNHIESNFTENLQLLYKEQLTHRINALIAKDYQQGLDVSEKQELTLLLASKKAVDE